MTASNVFETKFRMEGHSGIQKHTDLTSEKSMELSPTNPRGRRSFIGSDRESGHDVTKGEQYQSDAGEYCYTHIPNTAPRTAGLD